MRPELRIPWAVRLLFLAAVSLIALEATGMIPTDKLPAAHIAVALFAAAAVVWGIIAVMRFRR
ncbi:MAG: hypothetical protein JJ868_03780 [Shimia sp.]|uniref:hypothetical protein n=1 Tax=Shimia sp. TaxID=1954381 RepID=UPI0019E8E223|nr:hypothetical protein [Shimia sp.]MBE1291854.1 hypothetical protein [Paracoccaceae bacterium]MBO6896473.1 hypothetical protein [Shimia sp.]